MKTLLLLILTFTLSALADDQPYISSGHGYFEISGISNGETILWVCTNHLASGLIDYSQIGVPNPDKIRLYLPDGWHPQTYSSNGVPPWVGFEKDKPEANFIPKSYGIAFNNYGNVFISRIDISTNHIPAYSHGGQLMYDTNGIVMAQLANLIWEPAHDVITTNYHLSYFDGTNVVDIGTMSK